MMLEELSLELDRDSLDDLRLATALDLQNKLKLNLAVEPPYDILVRW
jgi:hypothetical protein